MSQAAQSSRPAAAAASTAASARRAAPAAAGTRTGRGGRPPAAAQPPAVANEPISPPAPDTPTLPADPEQARGLLPYGNSGKWAASELLANLTQRDNDDRTSTDAMRCVAVTTLASHIMEGPHSVATLTLKTMDVADRILKAGELEKQNPRLANNIRELLPYLRGVPKRLLTKKGTYKDLNRVSHLIKACAVWQESRATNIEDTKKINAFGAGTHHYVGQEVVGYEGVRNMVERLGGFGMQASLGIATTHPDGTTTGHSVLAGCDKAKGPWLYNPWPQDGSQILYFSKDADKLRAYLTGNVVIRVRSVHAHTAFG